MQNLAKITVNSMLNKNTWGVKVWGQSEATLQTGRRNKKGLISAEAKKLLYQIFVIP